ncbi:hypothetical protein KIL84_004150 [Mauremys mutica]|uniref:Uncharacterized protein n=1 Tax=Mauremys mutica TaxID=74926 RepID=A0A9D3XMI5_9SAUR|nr:hypothetical protein KIL84_004150 [Mauremys mutica]
MEEVMLLPTEAFENQEIDLRIDMSKEWLACLIKEREETKADEEMQSEKLLGVGSSENSREDRTLQKPESGFVELEKRLGDLSQRSATLLELLQGFKETLRLEMDSNIAYSLTNQLLTLNNDGVRTQPCRTCVDIRHCALYLLLTATQLSLPRQSSSVKDTQGCRVTSSDPTASLSPLVEICPMAVQLIKFSRLLTKLSCSKDLVSRGTMRSQATL